MTETIKDTSPSLKRMIGHTDHHDEKLSYFVLIKNEFFLARVLVILITIGILIVSISYCIGQVLEQVLTDYWCDKKSPQQIAQHSEENKLNEGDFSGCWNSKFFTVNNKQLWSPSSYSHAPVSDGLSWFKFVLFLIISLILLLLAIYNTILLVYDAKDWRIRVLGVSEMQKHSQSKVSEVSRSNIINCIIRYFSRLYIWYSQTFETDSGWWCIMLFSREIFEVIIQSITLLFYNGYFSSSSDDVPMAYSETFIILFTCIIAGNCTIACILWLCYAFKPYIFNGSLFEILIYCFDVIFDILYTLFPLIIVFESEQKVLTCLAALQTNTAITFFSTFIPLLLLIWSSYSFSLYAKSAMNNYYGKIFYFNQTQTEIEMDTYYRMEKSPSVETDLKVLKVAWVGSNPNNKCKKTALVSMVAILFGLYGITLLTVVISHFIAAVSYCSFVIDEVNNLHANNINESTWNLSESAWNILQQHPELLLYDRCDYKVYPFGKDRHGDYQCQCRFFYIKFSETERFMSNRIYTHKSENQYPLIDWSVKELDTYFGLDYVQILENIMKEWYMLEKFKWSGTKTKYREYSIEQHKEIEPPVLNFTADMFNAKQMKVFEIHETPIAYFDESISNWKQLAYFRMYNNGALFELPSNFNKLQQLVYFEISLNVNMQQFPKELCDLKALHAITMQLTEVNYIPHCVEQLQNLESIMFTAVTQLKAFPIGILNIKSLKEISMIQTAVTIQSLMEFNNFTNFTEFDTAFVIDYKLHPPTVNNNDITSSFWFQGSKLCYDYFGINENKSIPLQMVNVYRFIRDLEICQDVCDPEFTANDILAYVHCPPFKHHDGVCDDRCKSPECFFDGGDCSQLCHCDFEELLNDNCTVSCNTTACLYDGYKCLDTSYNRTECTATYDKHHCHQIWIDDGWCDFNCENSLECEYDSSDCDACENNLCNTVNALFNFVANSVTNDDLSSEEEICKFWDSLKNSGVLEEFENCTQAMKISDINDDQQLTLYEVLQITYEHFDLTREKAQQLDCSRCVGEGKYWVR